MKLKKFRIRKFRCINDSGWVRIEDITAVIGPNESGKTSLLKALYKLNPFSSNEKLDITREWPRGQRQDRSVNFAPVTAEFQIEDEDREALSDLFHRRQNVPKTVTVRRQYDKTLIIDWQALRKKPPTNGAEEEQRNQQREALASRLPVMVYMSDYEAFNGRAFLDEWVTREAENRLTPEDRTVEIIMKLSGLDLKKLQRSGQESEREREDRQFDVADAAQSLTNQIADRWRQQKYILDFTVDGQQFITHVREPEPGSPKIALEERSKGFQWFLSFDMKLMHDTRGTLKGAVLLLDEPGIHLHGDAQRDLLERFEAYSEANQTIYTTHLPFMLDMRHPERFRIMVSDDAGGWRATENPFETDKSTSFPFHVNMGFNIFQTLLMGPHNLVVEGQHDLMYLQHFRTRLERRIGENRKSLREEIVVTPAFGGSKVPYLCAMLSGQELNVAALLDSDEEGQRARDEIVNKWVLRSTFVIELAEICGAEGVTIEDLFDRESYLEQVNECYKDELGKPLKPDDLGEADKPILEVLEAIFESAGLALNKGRVAKAIVRKLARAKEDPKLGRTVENFEKLYSLINERTASWFSE